jgi:predicted transcriptional regulator
MSKTSVITARVDAETLALIDKVAKAQGRSRSWFVAQAVQRVAESEADFIAFVQEGLDAIDRGETVPHEQIMTMLDGMIAQKQLKCAA